MPAYQENTQPSKNGTTLCQFIPHNNGELQVPTTYPSALAVTAMAGVSYVPVGGYYSYPATPTWPIYPVYPSFPVQMVRSTYSPAITPQYTTAPCPAYSFPTYYTLPVPRPVTHPTTGSYAYGYYYYPVTTVAAPKPEPPRLPNGAVSWFGRTRSEVEHDNNLLATAGSVNAATFKPDAKPDQAFWVWEPDGLTRNLYTFAAIDKNFKGEWRLDPVTRLCYFVRI